MLSSHCCSGVDFAAGRFHHTGDTNSGVNLLSQDAALQGLIDLCQFVFPVRVVTATTITIRLSFSMSAYDNTHVASLQREDLSPSARSAGCGHAATAAKGGEFPGEVMISVENTTYVDLPTIQVTSVGMKTANIHGWWLLTLRTFSRGATD